MQSETPKKAVEADHRTKGHAAWTFLNSAFGLWLLSTVALSGGAWAFQQWNEAEKAQADKRARMERLTLEIAGRTSQFITGFIAEQTNARQALDAQQLRQPKLIALRDPASFDVHAIMAGFAARPSDPPARPGERRIVEISPEYRDRNLLSIIAELSSLRPDWTRYRGQRLVRVDENGKRLPMHPQTDSQLVGDDNLRDAMLALLSPEWLIAFRKPDYDTFKKRFSEAFLVGRIGRYPFPGLDCFDC